MKYYVSFNYTKNGIRMFGGTVLSVKNYHKITEKLIMVTTNKIKHEIETDTVIILNVIKLED